MTTLKHFITEAENARLDFVSAQNEAKAYAGCKPLKTLKKDPEFIRLTNKIFAAKKLWYDYNTAILIQAKEEKKQSILN